MPRSLLRIAARLVQQLRKNAQRKEVQKEIDGLVKERAEIEKKFPDSGAAIMRFHEDHGSKTWRSQGEVRQLPSFPVPVQDLVEQQQLLSGSVNVDALQAEYAAQQRRSPSWIRPPRPLATTPWTPYSVRPGDRSGSEGEMSPSLHHDMGSSAWTWRRVRAAGASAGGRKRERLAEDRRGEPRDGIEIETARSPPWKAAAQRNLTAVSAGKYVKSGRPRRPAYRP